MSKKKQTIIKPVIIPTREQIALTVSDVIQTCINSNTDFIMNYRTDRKAVTITAKKDYDKFKVLFPKAEIKSDTYASLYCELILKYE